MEVRLEPANPPAHPETIAAVREADWVVLGPGSWFTSVMPHLRVPELAKALNETPARRLLTLNVQLQTTETMGFTASQHLEVLARHAPEFHLDAVLADPSVVDERDRVEEAAARLGAELVVAAVAAPDNPKVHDVLRLAAAYRDLFA